MTKKYIPAIVIANVILVGAIIGAFVLGKQSGNPAEISPSPAASAVVSNQSSGEEIVDFAAQASVSGAPVKMGKVTGKLCYPSEMLPEGVIEAKRIDDGKIFTQNFPGSNKGGKNTYTFDLESGKYNLRYKTSDKSGYHTTVCQSGTETTCGNTSPRTLLTANIEPNETAENFDLCDFYYTDKNAPYY